MRYLGGKTRIAKHIVPLIAEGRSAGQLVVEPFAGGCNITSTIGGNRWANDNHHPLIKLWQALQGGWIPPGDVSRLLYNQIKEHPHDYPPELVAFVGFGCSFAGKFFGGYAGGSRNYAGEAKRACLRKAAKMQDVTFTCMDYRDMIIPSKSIIYCDPPYADTTGYTTSNFDQGAFWDWVRFISYNHTVFISEYNAPDDFKCIWQKEQKTTVGNTSLAKIERVFQWKS